MQAVLHAADAADLPDTMQQRQNLREMLVKIAALMASVPPHPLMRNTLRALYVAVPAIMDSKRPVGECLHDAVVAGLLTPSQAEQWRYRLGL
ncbi:hypothetical protein [Elioraea rosea]|uniref:hypothetical protein n=1 Tax=Elioraea rosea TaxID=2492390 RepID=UPI001183523E|nr:hypothetical protein [Elioraea rosea]